MKPWDEVTVRPPDDRMFILSNPYGFVVNINHPDILPLYNEYKARKGIPVGGGLSDKERLSFEWFISQKFSKEFNWWTEQYRYLMPVKAAEQIEKIEAIDFWKLIKDSQYKTLNEMIQEEKPTSYAERAKAFKAKIDKMKKEG